MDEFSPKTHAILSIIERLGFPAAVALYFFVKDWIFTAQLLELQTRIAVALDRIIPLLK